jgi:hypothetical protein
MDDERYSGFHVRSQGSPANRNRLCYSVPGIVRLYAASHKGYIDGADTDGPHSAC